MHIIQRNPVDPQNQKLLPNGSGQPLSTWTTHLWRKRRATSPPAAERTQAGLDQQAELWTGGGISVSAVFLLRSKRRRSGTNIGPVPPVPAKPSSPGTARSLTLRTTPLRRPQDRRSQGVGNFPTTAQLNSQWQTALAALKTPFKNYMLIGTQWGGAVEPEPGNKLPLDAVPAMLSNLTLETYIQNYTGSNPNLPGPGSCIGCHGGATLAVSPYPSADFSFLPSLAQPETARSKVKTAQ